MASVNFVYQTISQQKKLTGQRKVNMLGVKTITAKQWLNRARVLGAEIDKALQRGPDVDAARREVERMYVEWVNLKMEIVNGIYKLPDRRERIVLIDYYCTRMTIKEIAESDLEMSWKQTHIILKNAIKHLGEVLNLE